MVSQRRGSSLAAMRALGCLLAALWLLLAAPHVQAQACPSVVVTKARAKTTRTHAIIKMAVSLSKGSPYVNDAAIKISLPQGVSPVVGTRISRSQKGASRTISPYADGLNVYFTGLRLRKSITVVVRVRRRCCLSGGDFEDPYALLTGLSPLPPSTSRRSYRAARSPAP